MEENETRIKSGITINVDVSAKIQKTLCVQKRLYLILLHVLVKTDLRMFS